VVAGVSKQATATAHGCRNADRVPHLGRRGSSAITTVTSHTCPGEGSDGTVGIDVTQSMIVIVSRHQAAVAQQCNACRHVELRRRGATVVTGKSGDAGACNRGDGTIGPQAADAVVAAVGDPSPAVGSRRHAVRIVHTCRSCRTTIAAEAECACARNRRDEPVGPHTAQTIVVSVDDVRAAI